VAAPWVLSLSIHTLRQLLEAVSSGAIDDTRALAADRAGGLQVRFLEAPALTSAAASRTSHAGSSTRAITTIRTIHGDDKND
jgi:hypothetical protein